MGPQQRSFQDHSAGLGWRNFHLQLGLLRCWGTVLCHLRTAPVRPGTPEGRRSTCSCQLHPPCQGGVPQSGWQHGSAEHSRHLKPFVCGTPRLAFGVGHQCLRPVQSLSGGKGADGREDHPHRGVGSAEKNNPPPPIGHGVEEGGRPVLPCEVGSHSHHRVGELGNHNLQGPSAWHGEEGDSSHIARRDHLGDLANVVPFLPWKAWALISRADRIVPASVREW